MDLSASALFLFTLAACQCFQPVGELGFEPGVGGPPGADAGGAGLSDESASNAGPSCGLDTDCTLALPSDAGFDVYPCPNPDAAGMSCIAGRCLFTCTRGLSCEPDATSHCFTCRAPSRTLCGPTHCAFQGPCRLRVTISTCATGPLVGTELDLSKQEDCVIRVSVPDGGPVVGAAWDYDSNAFLGEFVGTFPGVDGACLGRDLPTVVPRMQWSCPGGCVFVGEGCP